MIKKTFLILISISIFSIAGYLYIENILSEEQQEAEDPAKEDRLSKSEQEGIEENINAFDIDDDLRITEESEEKDEDTEITALEQGEVIDKLEKIAPKSENTVLEQYESELPEAINKKLEYLDYKISFDYFLITAKEEVKAYETPVPDDKIEEELKYLDKVSLLQRVVGEELNESDTWYRIAFADNGKIKDAYLHSSQGKARKFRFTKMIEAINQLEEDLAEGTLHFVTNYKNHNGTPPQDGDIAVDEYGYRVYHSAPAYQEPDKDSGYRYAPDGILIRILAEVDNFYHVEIPTFGDDYYIPRQYIDINDEFNQLEQVIVVDREQQNQAAFELGENIDLVSYTLATTGIPGEFSFETTLGSYKVLQKRDRFEYLKSGVEKIGGYAPFAVRFTGGAYIHGVPVEYEEENGEKIDPGMIEYLHTIGTFPRSNMCVRNFTSHAEFLHNWVDSKKSAVIVIGED